MTRHSKMQLMKLIWIRYSMKTTLILLLSIITLTLQAQDDEVIKDPAAREKIYAARAAYITERLALTTDEAERFWPVYREYTQKRIDLRKQYRHAKRNETDEQKLLNLDLDIKQQELDLEKEYSVKLTAIISAQKMASLRQAEHDFRRLLLRQIQQRQGERRHRLRE